MVEVATDPLGTPTVAVAAVITSVVGKLIVDCAYVGLKACPATVINKNIEKC